MKLIYLRRKQSPQVLLVGIQWKSYLFYFIGKLQTQSVGFKITTLHLWEEVPLKCFEILQDKLEELLFYYRVCFTNDNIHEIWVMPQSVVGLLACWQGRFDRHRNGHIWFIVPHCLMWCLWGERNSGCFENNERSTLDLKLFFFRTLLDWLVAMRNQSFYYFLDFVDSCNFCTWIVDPLYTLCVLGCSIFDINKTYYLS